MAQRKWDFFTLLAEKSGQGGNILDVWQHLHTHKANKNEPLFKTVFLWVTNNPWVA